MKTHAEAIETSIDFITRSRDVHAVIIQGTAGYGKSFAVGSALRALGINAWSLGSYATALHFYKFLERHSSEFILVDDVAGLLGNDLSMSLLKAATWPQQNGKRIVGWGSTTSKTEVDEFEFCGKIVIVCNSFPNTSDARAVKSRSMFHKMDIGLAEAKVLILSSSRNQTRFPNQKIAKMAAAYLLERLSAASLSEISLRTLSIIYDFVEHNPEDWESHFDHILPWSPQNLSPGEFFRTINLDGASVREQEMLFEQKTGMRRRTFYNYKRKQKTSNL